MNFITNKMETENSLKIIEQMFNENRRSLHRNSFYFILWGVLLIPAGLVDWLFFSQERIWIIWPVVGILGGIISSIRSRKEDKRTGVTTMGDRMTVYIWGTFTIIMVISIVFSLSQRLSPTPLILLLAGQATFLSGGLSKVSALKYGGIILVLGGILCGFVFDASLHGLIFSISILLGYVYPGIRLKSIENA